MLGALIVLFAFKFNLSGKYQFSKDGFKSVTDLHRPIAYNRSAKVLFLPSSTKFSCIEFCFLSPMDRRHMVTSRLHTVV